jgi:hypothetical protein
MIQSTCHLHQKAIQENVKGKFILIVSLYNAGAAGIAALILLNVNRHVFLFREKITHCGVMKSR